MHNFQVYWISLCVFQTVFLSIIRSSRLYTHYQVYVKQVRWLLASKQSTNLYDIYLMLYIQPWTPDDGQKDRPKNAEWYSINLKIVHLVGFTVEIYHDAWCTDPWSSNFIMSYGRMNRNSTTVLQSCVTTPWDVWQPSTGSTMAVCVVGFICNLEITCLQIKVKVQGSRHLTLRVLMSYIYGVHILDVSRSHTTTHHSW
jgi:hypothetical protein